MVEATEGGVDKVTAYRTLDLFRRLQVIQELSYGRNKMIELSDDFVAHHHHFWCRECGKLTDFDDSKVEDALRDAVDASGAEIMSHHIEITGVCRECRARR
jgi:Fe2+ or Zn2+ uptake regulation protein